MTKFQNVLITGASSGIGKALAIHYASNGIKNLFICGRNQERLEEVAKECKKYQVEVHAKILDITNKEEATKWINDCEKTAPLNLVFANAGVATLEETPQNIYNTFEINLFGVLNTTIPAIETFKQRQDTNKTIAITSSIAGYHGLMTCPSYSASKAAVKAWGEAQRLALRPHNINVSVVCPGFVRSRITDKNTCPMPFFMEAPQAAQIIAERIEKNVGLIAFPWVMRLASWFGSVLPSRVSEFIYSKMPYKA